MENILDRLIKYMNVNNLNNNKITVKAELSNGLLGNAFKSGKGLNSDSIEKILLAYPNLNPNWFLTGHGEMYKEEKHNNDSIAADPPPEYESNSKKHIQQLENENKRLIADNERKQELIDSFLSGTIVVAKKETEYIESLHRISELERELKEFYKNRISRSGDMDGGLENVKIAKSKKGA